MHIRFGSWCYSGTVQLTPTLALVDIPHVIPALRMQQSKLDFMCDVAQVRQMAGLPNVECGKIRLWKIFTRDLTRQHMSSPTQSTTHQISSSLSRRSRQCFSPSCALSSNLTTACKLKVSSPVKIIFLPFVDRAIVSIRSRSICEPETLQATCFSSDGRGLFACLWGG